jgi:hypothetical protein
MPIKEQEWLRAIRLTIKHACTINVAKHFSQHRGSYARIGQDIDMAWNYLTLKSACGSTTHGILFPFL